MLEPVIKKLNVIKFFKSDNNKSQIWEYLASI